MSDFKDRMIEAYERGECSYDGAYDYVRESMADAADRRRKADRESGSGPPPVPGPRSGPQIGGPDRTSAVGEKEEA